MIQSIKRNILPVMMIIGILAAVGLAIYLKMQPNPSPADLMSQNPRYTFRAQCLPEGLAVFYNGRNTISDPNDSAYGMDKPGKDSRKYSLACKIPPGSQVIPHYPETVVDNSIPLPKPGESPTYTILDERILVLVDLEKSAARINQPIDSEGVDIIPLVLKDWAPDYVLNLYCFEEVSTSTNQPEHVCWVR